MENSMSVSLVYVNTADRAEALTIGRALVEAGLAASANVVPEIYSVYDWQGEIKERSEAVLILKTKSALLDDIVDRVQALHSYECPAIVAVPVTGGNPDYLDWVERETGGAA
jgi:periplasmic divalent cation tolerance protein